MPDQMTQDGPTDAKLKDRTLKLTCTPLLTWSTTNPGEVSATMSLAVDPSGTQPPMVGILSPTGATTKIDIDHMPVNPAYSDNLDITLKLDTSQLKNPDGTNLSGKARWAKDTEGTWSDGTNSGVLGYLWFCNTNSTSPAGYDVTPPMNPQPLNLTPFRNDDSHIGIDDNTPEGPTEYAFCVGLVLEHYDNKFIPIDPIISGKGVGGTPTAFMLKE